MTGHEQAGLLLGAFLFAAAPLAAQPIGRGAPVTAQPDEDPNLQYAASVGQVHALTHQGDLSPTLFSTVAAIGIVFGVILMVVTPSMRRLLPPGSAART